MSAAEDRFREAAALPVSAFEASPLGEAHTKAEAAKLETRAKSAGLSVAEVRAADAAGLDLLRYAALRNVRSVEDYRRVGRELAARAEARAEAERQVAVETARKEL